VLKGKKTYLISLAMLVFNAVGLYLHQQGGGGLDPAAAWQGMMTAAGLAGLRNGVGPSV
jgi:hypothetical protein